MVRAHYKTLLMRMQEADSKLEHHAKPERFDNFAVSGEDVNLFSEQMANLFVA